MFKKMMLLASMALAVVAFAVPASASAAEWVDAGNSVAGNPHLKLTGPYCSSAGAPPNSAGFCATLDVTIEMNGGTDKGKVKSFTLTNCLGTGLLQNLRCTNTPGAEWEVTAEATGTRIKNMVFVNHYYSPLDPTHVTILTSTTTSGDLFLRVNSEEEISSASVEGSGLTLNGFPATATGTLGVSPAGTYGVE